MSDARRFARTPTGDTGEQELAAVRVAGAGVLAWFGQLAVSMPSGYFGAKDTVTTFGLAFGALALALAGLGCIGMWRRAAWSRVLVPVATAINAAVFSPALGTDPLVAAVLIGWQLYVLVRHLLATHELTRSLPRTRRWHLAPTIHAPHDRLGRAAAHALGLSVLCTIGVAGFRLTEQEIGPVSCLILDGAVLVFVAPILWPIVKRRPRLWLLLGLGFAVAVSRWQNLNALVGVLGVVQTLLLARVLINSPLAADLLRLFFASPGLLLTSTFGALCLAGTVVLSFPAATTRSISVIDALFTATSAVCVTGLIVVDTPIAFSTFGQLALLFLMQVGGLGIMVLSTFATLALGGRLGLRGEQALGNVLERSSPARAYQLAKFIVLATFTIEAIGGVCLAIAYKIHGVAWPQALWRGLFHSISAFCNAGFALQSDSLMMFQESPGTLLVFSLLIVSGGLGFVVLAWLWQRATLQSHERASVHVRVVLATTAVLLLLGFVEFAAVEWHGVLSGLSHRDKLANAWFQSVTTRTAGFNSVDLTPMHSGTILTFTMLMFIGASPGGTGGGIKTSTLAVLLAAVPSLARGDARARLFRREIDAVTVLRASTIMVIALLFVCLGSFMLLVTQRGTLPVLVFEAVSALGTVGLSLGATSDLDTIGKVTVTLLMFVGRVGPLSLALLIAQGRSRHIEYPSAQLMVG